MNTTRLVVALSIVGLLASGVVERAEALKLRVGARAEFNSIGDGNPFLDYEFFGSHSVEFLRYSALESVLPVTLVGNILRNGGVWTDCFAAGLVISRRISCGTYAFVPCPAAQAVWEAETFGTVLVEGFNMISGPIHANCVPLPCEEAPQSQITRLIDLDSGLRVDQTIADAIDPSPMWRRETVSGKRYVQNEWAILEAAEDGGKLDRAASASFAAHAEALAAGLPGGLTEGPGGRYLLVQGREHAGGLRRPLVRFDRDSISLAGSSDTRAVLRAVFGGDGSLHSVEALEGSQRTAEAVARGMKIDFLSADRHRVEVYSVFDLRADAELLSAEPFFVLCCE